MKPENLPSQVESANSSASERGSEFLLGSEKAENKNENIEKQTSKSEINAIAAEINSVTTSSQLVVNDDNVAKDTTKSIDIADNDDEIIARIWVDKAKNIINETKDDPYKQEQAVGQLQKDYLKDRYGREFGAAKGQPSK